MDGVLRILRTLQEQELELNQVPDIMGLSQTHGCGIMGQPAMCCRYSGCTRDKTSAGFCQGTLPVRDGDMVYLLLLPYCIPGL